jgi:uncharacterized protein with FMN-binding domain
MRRAILTLGGTAAGLAALLSFKTHSPAAAAADPVTPAAASSTIGGGGTGLATGAPAATAQSGGAARATAGAKASGGATATASATASGGATAGGGASTATRTVTGAVENTAYGPMQVQITLTGQRITQVNVLQHTNSGAMSEQIDSFAIPKLTAETLAAQSARIDAVSGASYTSSGYIQSLQSALDKTSA